LSEVDPAILTVPAVASVSPVPLLEITTVEVELPENSTGLSVPSRRFVWPGATIMYNADSEAWTNFPVEIKPPSMVI